MHVSAYISSIDEVDRDLDLNGTVTSRCSALGVVGFTSPIVDSLLTVVHRSGEPLRAVAHGVCDDAAETGQWGI